MQISLAVLREIKVDHHIDSLDIDTAREEVRADEVAANAITEVVEDTIAVRLEHFRMGVEARITELCDLFGQELDSVGRVTEDDRLINLKL